MMDAGLDSLAAEQFANSVLTQIGLAIEPTAIFEHPTPEAVALHLAQRKRLRTPSARPPVRRESANVLMASLSVGDAVQRWPGGCARVARLHTLLNAAGDALGSPPSQRWILEDEVNVCELSEGQRKCIQHGGYLDAERFDNAAFQISPAEVGWMDPHQRLLLEVGFQSLHGHGMRRQALLGSEVGHFLGMSKADWSRYQFARRGGYASYSVYATTCDSNTVASGRLSFVLGMHGPCMTVDTACSSALVGLQTARLNLRAGECDTAVVTAVRLELTLQHTLDAAFASMLSLNGRCFTLDQRADGYVSSEGACAIVVYIPIREEMANAFIERGAVRCDGRSASLTAPNGAAQATMIAAANAGTPCLVCVELHGTGTALGDPTEMSSLATALKRLGNASSLLVGGAKASFGHTMATSGVLSICKILLQAKGSYVLPNCQLCVLNRLVTSSISKLHAPPKLLTQRVECLQCRSGVSSFGYSGTIAHIVLSRSAALTSTQLLPHHSRLQYRCTSFVWVRQKAASAAMAPERRPALAQYLTCWSIVDSKAAGTGTGAGTGLVLGTCPWYILSMRAAAIQHPTLQPCSAAVIGLGGLTTSQLSSFSVIHNFAVLLDSVASASPSHVSAQAIVQVVQRIVELDAGNCLLLLTFGVFVPLAAGPPTRISSAAHSSCAGLLYAIRKEHAALPIYSYDMDLVRTRTALVLDEQAIANGAEWSRAQCGSLLFAPRLRYASALPLRADLRQRGDQFLITGGLGGLGLRAGALLHEASSGLTLTSRSGRVPRDGQNLEQLLSSLVATCTTSLVCDVHEGRHVIAAFDLQRITGVVHAAGVSTDSALSEVNLAQLVVAFAPKACGAAHIHSAATTLALTALVALSSISTFWCRDGQGCYAAANAFLDGHALARRRQGHVGVALSLPGIEGMGMGAALNVRRKIQMSLIQYDVALAALLITSEGAVSISRPVLPSKLERFVRGTADGRSPLFHEAAVQSVATPAVAESPFALPSCQLTGSLHVGAALSLLCTLPRGTPALMELLGLQLESNAELEVFTQGFAAPITILCRGEVSGSGVCALLAASSVSLGEESCTLCITEQSMHLSLRRGSSTRASPGKHTAHDALLHGWLDAVYPDATSKIEAQRLAARLAQISSALLSTCKVRLPAVSVDAAVLAMGTLFHRKPRHGPRLVRVRTDAHARAAVVELCDEGRSNTISHELAADVLHAASSIHWHGSIRTVALYGKGEHFSVGVNPYNYCSAARVPLAASACSCELLLQGFVHLRTLCMPFTCAVHGKLIGAALAASLNADYNISHAAATFCHGNIVRGVCPLGMLSQTLLGRVGRSRALCMYLTNAIIGSAQAMSSGLVHEVVEDVSVAQQRATGVAWLLVERPEDSVALVRARDPLDVQRIAAEALGHASCLDANGGRYATSDPLAPDGELPTGFAPIPLADPAHTESVSGAHAGVHHVEVPVTLTIDALLSMCQWPVSDMLFVRAVTSSANFCLGGDPSEARLQSGDFLRAVPAFAQLLEHLQRRSSPTIVICRGATRGFGMLFPCMGTSVLAPMDATFGFPEVRRGVLPGVVSFAAQQRLCPTVCERLFCTGEAFDCDVAQRLGLVDYMGSVQGIDALSTALSHNFKREKHLHARVPLTTALPFLLDGSKRIARVLLTASMEPDVICSGIATLANSDQCQALRVVVLHIEGSAVERDSSKALSNDSLAQLDAAVSRLTSDGVIVLCSMRGHIEADWLRLGAYAHFRIADARATFRVDQGQDPASVSRRELLQSLLRSEDAASMLKMAPSNAQAALAAGFANEVVNGPVEEHALRFAQWLAGQPPMGIKHMLRLTFFSRSLVSKAPSHKLQIGRARLQRECAAGPQPPPATALQEETRQRADAVRLQMRKWLTAPARVHTWTDLPLLDFEPAPTSSTIKQLFATNSSAPQLQSPFGTSDTRAVEAIARELVGTDLSADVPLMQAGLDSLGATEFRSRLSERLADVEMPVTLVFDFPTLRQLESHVLLTSSPVQHCSQRTRVASSAFVKAHCLRVLIAGSSILLPSGVSSHQSMSFIVMCGHNAICQVPAVRWDVDMQQSLTKASASSRVRHGGFIWSAEFADNAAFTVSPSEAAAMDPCQRLLLEHGYAAMRDAALDRARLGGSLTGIFLGFAQVCSESPVNESEYAATGWSVSIASGRLSYALGLHGPCTSFDTACSAALVAGHAGLRALQLNECLDSLVVGVMLMLVPAISASFATAGMTSARGRSHTFDTRADGYVRGEACGGVTLCCEGRSRGLTFAGSAVRQDGRSASLTAPNGQAQHGLLVAALADADALAESLTLIEAHGTGTALGDPIEAGSFATAILATREALWSAACLDPDGVDADSLPVGSVKANVGHAEPAAGMTGLLKLADGLQQENAAPNAQLRSLNAHIGSVMRYVACGLIVVATPTFSRTGEGGVSSFGYSGTIAHTVLRCKAKAVVARPLFPPYRRRAFPWVRSSAAPLQSAPLLPPRISSMDADTPLMEAGLQSQRVVRLAARLRELSGEALSAMLIFDHPTPRAIATHLSVASENQVFDVATVLSLTNDALLAGSGSKEAPRAVLEFAFGVPIDAEIPGSTFQQHFLILHLLQPHVALYSLPALIKVPCRLPQPVVQAALHQLLRRHAVLRTIYALEQGRALQAILPIDGISIPLDECTRAQWVARTRQLMNTPFALTMAPPIRALQTCSSSSKEAQLLLMVDHVAADYASTLLMQAELCAACVSLRKGTAPTLHPLKLQYADFALWQVHGLGDGAIALAWWRIKLEGAPQLLEVPTDWTRSVMRKAIADTVRAELESYVAAEMAALCAQERVSPLCCLLAAWAALMLQLSGQRDVVLGQPYSVQSEHSELKDLIGCFATPIPVRITKPSPASNFRQMLHDVYVELLQAIEHAEVPLFQIVGAFGVGHSSTHNALFQTIVQLLPLGASGANLSPSDPADSLVSNLQGIDLFLNFVESGSALDGRLTFNAAIFSTMTANKLMARFTSMIRCVVRAPDTHVDLVMETETSESDELRRVGSASGRTWTDFIRQGDECVASCEIEDLLLRHPSVVDAIAFAAAHHILGEVVGAMVVLHAGHTVSLRELRATVASSLATQWQPQVLIEANEVPRGGSVRRDLAARFGLPGLSNDHDTWAANMIKGRLDLKQLAPSHDVVGAIATRPGVDLVMDTVLDIVRAQTRNDHVDTDTPLMDAGLNSLGAVQLALALERQIGVTLPATLIFQYRSAFESDGRAALALAFSHYASLPALL